MNWADLHLDQILPLYGTILTHSELFGAIWTQFGLVWYDLVLDLEWDKARKTFIMG